MTLNQEEVFPLALKTINSLPQYRQSKTLCPAHAESRELSVLSEQQACQLRQWIWSETIASRAPLTRRKWETEPEIEGEISCLLWWLDFASPHRLTSATKQIASNLDAVLHIGVV